MRAVSGFRARTHVLVVWWGAAVVVEVWESGALDGSRDSLCSRVNEWWYGEARYSSRVLEGPMCHLLLFPSVSLRILANVCRRVRRGLAQGKVLGSAPSPCTSVPSLAEGLCCWARQPRSQGGGWYFSFSWELLVSTEWSALGKCE